MSRVRSAEQKARRVEVRSNAVANGLCGRCLAEPQVTGLTSCRSCLDKASAHRADRQSDPVRRLKHNEDNARRKRARRAEYASGKSCALCGSSGPLELDHIDPATKTGDDVLHWAKDRRDAEYAKCQWLCVPCHQKKTMSDLALSPRQHGSRGLYNAGCRCDLCRLEHNAYQRARRARLRNSKPNNPEERLVPMDTTQRDALQRSIAGRLCPLSHDELRVLDWVLSGLEKGVEPYGRLDVSKERRDFRLEAAQEFRDAFVYLAGDYIARVDRRRERVALFRDMNDPDPSDEDITGQFRPVGISNASDGRVPISAASAESSGVAPAPVDIPPSADAAPISCGDCGAEVHVVGSHNDGCPWITIVPANDEVAL